VTYIPSSTARRERGTGDERPELVGDTERRPLNASRFMLAAQDDSYKRQSSGCTCSKRTKMALNSWQCRSEGDARHEVHALAQCEP